MSLEIGATVSGKIVEVTAEGIIVSLPEGKSGLIPALESLSFEAMQVRFTPGMNVAVRIVALGGSDRVALRLLPVSETEEASAFDREFRRLNHVLTSRSVAQRDRPRHDRPTIEEEIEGWIEKVEEGLSRLRKHRGERLSEEFYSEKE